MAEQGSDVRQLEQEGRSARRLAAPILVMIVLVIGVMAVAMAVAQPWEGGGSQERSAPLTPTATP